MRRRANTRFTAVLIATCVLGTAPSRAADEERESPPPFKGDALPAPPRQGAPWKVDAAGIPAEELEFDPDRW
jgi:hypothetical protein